MEGNIDVKCNSGELLDWMIICTNTEDLLLLYGNCIYNMVVSSIEIQDVYGNESQL